MSGGGAHSAEGFTRLERQLPAIQDVLAESGVDGWLLYDFRARNAVAGSLLGLGELSRRYFVLVPARGEPQALTHGIEQGPWETWPWQKRRYVRWTELQQALRQMVSGAARVAMEISAEDAVPPVDLVPAGVLELVSRTGVEVVSSGDLVSRFHSAWTAEQLDSHRRAARVLAQVAAEAFEHIRERLARSESVNEVGLRRWVLDQLERRGFGVGADSIVANGKNASNPHYEAQGTGAELAQGDVVLIDLWSKEAEDLVYADQTWMGFVGDEVPARVAEVFAAIRDGRDAAVEFLRNEWAAGRRVQGYQVDDVTRGVVAGRGFGDAFIHRTGHSIDRATHGMGPNIDNFETHETRVLLPGVGFSIEPGVYFPGELGMRTEINMYIGESGPEVTTPDPQRSVFALLREAR